MHIVLESVIKFNNPINLDDAYYDFSGISSADSHGIGWLYHDFHVLRNLEDILYSNMLLCSFDKLIMFSLILKKKKKTMHITGFCVFYVSLALCYLLSLLFKIK